MDRLIEGSIDEFDTSNYILYNLPIIKIGLGPLSAVFTTTSDSFTVNFSWPKLACVTRSLDAYERISYNHLI